VSGPANTIPATGRVQVPDAADTVRRQARRLGYAGLLPFLVCSVLYLLVTGDMRQQAGQALVAYGTIIASFLGALHWSAAILAANREAVAARMTFAVTPALLGWLAILLPLHYGLLLLIATLWLAYLVDRRWLCGHAWYLVLRRRLTLVATLSLAVAAVAALKEI
jgi:hypothetical protein